MTATEQELVTIECLRHAIEDTQGTIRAYDLKAEILAALITLTVTLFSQSLFAVLSQNGQCVLKLSWGVCLITIFFLGLVLFPKSNLFSLVKYGNFSPKSTYFLHKINSSANNTVSEIAAKAIQTNWVEELTFESMKLSLIRDRKHELFVNSLWPSLATLVLLAIALFIG